MVFFKCHNKILSEKVESLERSLSNWNNLSYKDIRKKIEDLISYIEYYINEIFSNSKCIKSYRDILDIIHAINLVVSNFYFKNIMMIDYKYKLIDILLNICLNQNIEIKIIDNNRKNKDGNISIPLIIGLLFNYNKESLVVHSYNIDFYKAFLSSYAEKIDNEKIIQDIFKFIM